jgi:hypothetical protein
MNQGQIAKIELGSICIEIQCRDKEFMEKMLVNYHPFLVSRMPDFRVRLNLRNKLTVSEVKQLLVKSRSSQDGTCVFAKPELLECRINWAEATLWVDIERELFAPSVDYKLMNHLLLGIYAGIYARLRNTSPDAYLVHGCGIVAGKQCYLFTGPSGSGKTTIARLAQGRKVLNDEAVLIGENKDGLYISGTPFEGGQPEKRNTSAKLSTIFFLKHGKQASLRKLSKVETYIRLLSQIFATSPLFEASDNDCLQKRANLSADMATGVPAYELNFRPDTSFWQVIEAI